MSIVLSAKGGGERVRCHGDTSGVPKRGFVVCGGLVESKPYFFWVVWRDAGSRALVEKMEQDSVVGFEVGRERWVALGLRG